MTYLMSHVTYLKMCVMLFNTREWFYETINNWSNKIPPNRFGENLVLK